MSLPNFICLGAAKSGTTTLCDILRQHPEIYIPSFKSSNLRHIPLGTPLRLVRGWYSSDGELWLQVQINSIRLIETNPLPIRGWINA